MIRTVVHLLRAGPFEVCESVVPRKARVDAQGDLAQTAQICSLVPLHSPVRTDDAVQSGQPSTGHIVETDAGKVCPSADNWDKTNDLRILDVNCLPNRNWIRTAVKASDNRKAKLVGLHPNPWMLRTPEDRSVAEADFQKKEEDLPLPLGGAMRIDVHRHRFISPINATHVLRVTLDSTGFGEFPQLIGLPTNTTNTFDLLEGLI